MNIEQRSKFSLDKTFVSLRHPPMNKTFLSGFVGLCLAASVNASPVGTTIESDIPLGQAVTLVNKVATVITSIHLDKGKWVVSGAGQLFETIPQTVTGNQTLNCSAWISFIEPFNHQVSFRSGQPAVHCLSVHRLCCIAPVRRCSSS